MKLRSGTIYNPLEIPEWQKAYDYHVTRCIRVGDIRVSLEMRNVLVDWIYAVCVKFELHPCTFGLSTLIIDRYLECVSITKKQLPLFVIASLMIAAKYEEVNPPEIRDYEYICDRNYTLDEIRHAERMILQMLNYDLNYSTVFTFLPAFLKQIPTNPEKIFRISYYLELCLTRRYEQTPQLVSACVWLVTGKKIEYFEPNLIQQIQTTLSTVSPKSNVYVRYCKPMYLKVALNSATPCNS